MSLDNHRGADISEDGRYRYVLWRDGLVGDDDRACLFIMLNPSTADATKDDPTIRKCIGFCKRWGYGQLFVVNLFAFRTTDPKWLLSGAVDPVGPCNNMAITGMALCCGDIVCAWGAPTGALGRLVAVREVAAQALLSDLP